MPSHGNFSSDLFTPYRDPQSGVTSYILTQKVAPVQQGFYFVNDGMTADGRYLWFYCVAPPSVHRTLAVVDLEKHRIHHYPETQFNAASPYVDAETGAVYWCSLRSVWRRGPEPEDGAELVNSIPDELIGHRRVFKMATHLTRSADGKEFFLDITSGLQFLHGSLPLDGGDFRLWQRYDRSYNHAQFSPVDPDRVLFAEEMHFDQVTGLRVPFANRMWLITRGGSPRPVFDVPTVASHEWWDGDGRHVWCVSGGDTWRVDIETQNTEKMRWSGGAWHSHCSRDGSLLVGDCFTHEQIASRSEWDAQYLDPATGWHRGRPSEVNFLNRDTGGGVRVLSNPGLPTYTGRHYHIDPHPRFCCSDRYIVFTTTVRGEVDLAVTPVAELLQMTSG